MVAVQNRKTNERPGTRAQVRYARVSAYKAREVLDLIRGLPVDRADEVLQFTERVAVTPILRKVLASAVANAEHNDELDASTLYVSACYADEGPTLKRWRPRARGRATRIRKRTCHITIIVSTMTGEMLAKVEADRSSTGAQAGFARRGRAARDARRARVARSRGEAAEETTTDEVVADEVEDEPTIDDEALGEGLDLDDEDIADADDGDDTDDGDDADEKPAKKKAAAKKAPAKKKAAAKKATAKKAAAKKTAAKKKAAAEKDENEDED
jgi:large subunit ribosomal protein L22